MRFTASMLVLFGMLLIAFGRHHIRRARKLKDRNPDCRTWPRCFSGWILTALGFLAILAGFTIWY